MSEPEKGSSPAPDDQHAGTVATENPGAGGPGERHEVGDSASSRRDPPHGTENGGAALPANAGGTDRVSSDEQDFEVNEESAYDRRPTQDKDRPASSS